MADDLLESLELETAPSPGAGVIWMHGLGADGYDFVDIPPVLRLPDSLAVRFVFPHAPMQPVTINGGMVMRAWYDVRHDAGARREDEVGVRASQQRIEALIARETARGIPAERLILAGFSQGGAMALHTGTRYPHKLAGIMGLSCYLPLSTQLAAERSEANLTTPIFLAHGTQDPVVSLQFGEESRRLLEEAGYRVEWHAYPMPHAVSPEEVDAIAAWLRQRL